MEVNRQCQMDGGGGKATLTLHSRVRTEALQVQ